jgi:hypothetical protein
MARRIHITQASPDLISCRRGVRRLAHVGFGDEHVRSAMGETICALATAIAAIATNAIAGTTTPRSASALDRARGPRKWLRNRAIAMMNGGQSATATLTVSTRATCSCEISICLAVGSERLLTTGATARTLSAAPRRARCRPSAPFASCRPAICGTTRPAGGPASWRPAAPARAARLVQHHR